MTLHPAMGVYLSMLGNQKPNPAANIRPDENYARELMQLFTIGLVELDIDGTPRLDGAGQPIPTYTQPIIEGFAHVYTGWTYAGHRELRAAAPHGQNQVQPMQLYPNFHDTGAKLVLGGVTLPAGQGGAEDLRAALDSIFAHANVGPFVARRLIQRLVTSNPSPGYVSRVAQRFNDNGRGVRGDLGAVVKAILLDLEARGVPTADERQAERAAAPPRAALARVRRADAASGSYAGLRNPSTSLGQAPLQSPSVFNFFSPFYAPPGEIRDAGLVAPELEIATEYQNTSPRILRTYTFNRNSRTPGLTPEDIVIDIEAEVAVAADANALVNLVADKLLAGQISTPLRTEIVEPRQPLWRYRRAESCGASRLLRRHFARVRVAAMSAKPIMTNNRREFCWRPARARRACCWRGRTVPSAKWWAGRRPSPIIARSCACSCSAATTPSTCSCRAARRAQRVRGFTAESRDRASRLVADHAAQSRWRAVRAAPLDARYRDLFEQEHAAFVANVGPLLAPTTKAQYQAKSVALPPQLFSHNDQQNQWHSLRGNTLSDSGWAGRIADLIRSNVANQQLATNVSLSGNSLFQSGDDTVAYSMGAGGPLAFSGFGAAGLHREQRLAFERIIDATYDSVYARAFADVQRAPSKRRTE